MLLDFPLLLQLPDHLRCDNSAHLYGIVCRAERRQVREQPPTRYQAQFHISRHHSRRGNQFSAHAVGRNQNWEDVFRSGNSSPKSKGLPLALSSLASSPRPCSCSCPASTRQDGGVVSARRKMDRPMKNQCDKAEVPSLPSHCCNLSLRRQWPRLVGAGHSCVTLVLGALSETVS